MWMEFRNELRASGRDNGDDDKFHSQKLLCHIWINSSSSIISTPIESLETHNDWLARESEITVSQSRASEGYFSPDNGIGGFVLLWLKSLRVYSKISHSN